MPSTMDFSDAPTQAAVNKHSMNRGGSVVSFLTADIVEEDEDFKRVAVLCGRDAEIKAIREAYERGAKGQSEVFLVRGASGTGKSTLVESMRELVTKNDGGYFVSGKFDQLATGKEPFSAISAAFSDICDLILQSDELEDRRRSISAALGPDSQLLSRVVSNMEKLSNTTVEAGLSAGTVSINTEDFTRFKLACQAFLRTVATEDRPLLVFLDDIQWADEMSMKLIRSLLQDTQSHHMLLCLAYRDDEAGSTTLLDLDRDTEEKHLSYSEVEVKNLDSSDLGSLLAQLLHIDNESSLKPLTTLVLDKTKGNPNTVIQLLQNLKSKRLLTFSDQSYSWEWDMHLIESEVSDDPTEIIAQKIASLDADAQEMLKLAAYLGHSFDMELLRLVAFGTRKVSPNTSGIDETTRCIRHAVANDLIQARGNRRYRFTHDSFQHYLYNSMETNSEQQIIHLRIGRALMTHCNSSCDETFVLLAASNLARSDPRKYISEDSEKLMVMKLFIEAAGLAASKVSVVDAREFLMCAMGMTTKCQVEPSSKLNIDLQNMYAEIQSCTGFFDESDKAVNVVLQNSTSPTDRARAHCTKIRSLGYQQKPDEVLVYAIETVLTDLHEGIPIRPSRAQVLIELCRTKIALRKSNPEDFLAMPDMENREKHAVMEVFSILFPVVFLLPDKSLYLFSTLRQIRLSVKYGISPFAASSLISYALVLSLMGKVEESTKLAHVSLDMSSRDGYCLNARALCLACTGLFILPWTVPLVNLVDPMLESYRCGLKGGSDFSVAFYGLVGYLEARSHLGAPLAEFEDELRRYCVQMKELQAHKMFTYQVPLWQYVLNLLGQSDDCMVLTGETMNEGELLEHFRSGKDQMGLQILNRCQFRLQISFEDWDAAKETLPWMIKGLNGFAGGFTSFFRATDIVMVSLVLYERGREKSFLRSAHRFTKMLRKWAKAGVPDVLPLLALVDAEWESVQRKETAGDAYDTAIQVVKEHRFIHYEMMAYQRAAHLALRTFDVRKARSYLTTSIERHRQWGNNSMVEWLQATYYSVISSAKPAFEINITPVPVL